MRKAIVFGSGAREHALGARLSEEGWSVTVAPGNAGIARQLACAPLDLGNVAAGVALARSLEVGLAAVGPEAPLIAGLADGLRAAGIATFGPSAKAARIEGSKAFAKEVMVAAGVPTARHRVVGDAAAARRVAAEFGGQLAIKADGIAAGKGVFVCGSLAEADQAIAELLERKSLGAAGETLVLEERLSGPEVSLFAICDGTRAFALPLSHDYKRIGDGDTGPNTGGMGAVAPTPRFADAEALLPLAITPVLEELKRRGAAFNGLLYAGVMLTPDGPRVLEYNCRFGDPETQVVLQILDGELGEALLACARGSPQATVKASKRSAVGVVAAARGYPAAPELGEVISGWDAAEAAAGKLFAAGVGKRGEALVTSGGRVATVVGVGADRAAARARAYGGLSKLTFAGLQARSDVAA